jgi:hypothetical protein
MKKLDFLLGKWAGEASVWRGPGEPFEITQTEDVQYKLDGLVLLIEGTGRNKSDGEVVFRALATVSYDDAAGVYRIRAHNDGRFIDTELKLVADKGFDGGFTAGPAKISYKMRINELGEWTETGEATIGDQPARKFVNMNVKPLK